MNNRFPRRRLAVEEDVQNGSGYLGSIMGGRVSQSNNCVRLGTFLSLNDVEFHVIALFQSFVTIQLDCRVVNENIRPVIASDESVALGVVEPLDLAFVLSHRVLPFLPLNGVGEIDGEPTLPTMTLIWRQRFIGIAQMILRTSKAEASASACPVKIQRLSAPTWLIIF